MVGFEVNLHQLLCFALTFTILPLNKRERNHAIGQSDHTKLKFDQGLMLASANEVRVWSVCALGA